MKIKKILILTSNYGDGHLKTANSLLKQIKETDSDIEVKIVNLFDEAHPSVNKFIRYCYLKSYSITPRLYNFIYYFTKHPSRNYYFNTVNGFLGVKKLKEYLEDFKPDLVINTFSILAMPKFYKKGITKVPCYTIVTDYGIHSQWMNEGTYRYFVSHDELKNEMLGYGVPKEKIEVTGIPAYLDCDEDIDKNKVLERNDLKDLKLPIITVLGGANGVMQNMDEVCKKLYNIRPEAQFILVCGKNKKLKERLEAATSNCSDRVNVLGYVDNLHELMKASDIVVTKPGGITITEGLNLHVPMIIYGIPSGQENENTKYLLKNNCSCYAKNINELIDCITKLLKEPAEIDNMRESCKTVSKCNACKDIINRIFEDFTAIVE